MSKSESKDAASDDDVFNFKPKLRIPLKIAINTAFVHVDLEVVDKNTISISTGDYYNLLRLARTIQMDMVAEKEQAPVALKLFFVNLAAVRDYDGILLPMNNDDERVKRKIRLLVVDREEDSVFQTFNNLDVYLKKILKTETAEFLSFQLQDIVEKFYNISNVKQLCTSNFEREKLTIKDTKVLYDSFCWLHERCEPLLGGNRKMEQVIVYLLLILYAKTRSVDSWRMPLFTASGAVKALCSMIV
jgi:hypothetical protein